MNGINTGKVVTGGLVGGLVLNILDFVNNSMIMGADFAANATRLGLDPAAMEAPAIIASWVVIDFLMGILIVFTYAAIRPRFGAGVKTAVCASSLVWALSYLYPNLFMVITGIFPTNLVVMATVWGLVEANLAGIAGAWAYTEAHG